MPTLPLKLNIVVQTLDDGLHLAEGLFFPEVARHGGRKFMPLGAPIRALLESAQMVSNETLMAATRRLVARFQPERVILFGSQARGTADARSDVNLLVITPISGNRRALMVAMDRALKGLPIARDIVVLTPDEFERDRQIPGTVARPAWREGRVLYERPAS